MAGIPKKNIWVIILVWNNWKDTKECLSSLSHENILLVDNGSTDETVAETRRLFPHVHILENRENLGFAEGNNRGIKWALAKGADAVLILNNDTIVPKNLVDAFASRFSPTTLLGAKIFRNDTHFDHLGGNWNPKTNAFDLIGLNEPDTGQYDHTLTMDYITGCALFAPKELFETIGYFEPRYFLFWEESDLCTRAIRAGFACRLCPEATLFHKGSASFTGGRPHTTYFWWRNRLLYMKRNLSPSLYRRELFSSILPEMTHLIKLYLLKSFLSLFKKPSSPAKILQYRASWWGFRDYFLGRFGNAPSKVFKK